MAYDWAGWGEGYKRIIIENMRNTAPEEYFDGNVTIGLRWYKEQLIKFCFPRELFLCSNWVIRIQVRAEWNKIECELQGKNAVNEMVPRACHHQAGKSIAIDNRIFLWQVLHVFKRAVTNSRMNRETLKTLNNAAIPPGI